MAYVVILIVAFLASVLGAACGLGGGVIIKPVIDVLGVLSVSTASFLSSCTVLTMSTYNVLRNVLGGKNQIDMQRGTYLGVGAAIGGILGKLLFEYIKGLSSDANAVGAVQAAALMVATIGTAAYTIKKSKIKTLSVSKGYQCTCIGLALGALAAFLGIGGGPINLVVLFYFFSMDTKIASQNSLYIIMLSQSASLLLTIFAGNVPPFRWFLLIGMGLLGILGGVVGRIINKKFPAAVLDRVFLFSMYLIIMICCFNIYRYS